MASAINVGSINLPKMMRHLSHRSSQVRDLTFVRDAIKQKDVKTTKADDSSLTGPAVSFGYEKSASTALTGVADDTVYHADSPEIVLPGLTMLQSPIVSRRGRLEKTGHRISGACTFYAPSLDYIKALDNFKDTKAFAELESYDKLYDMERVLKNFSYTTTTHATHTISFDDATAGYEADRLQFKIKTSGNLVNIILNGAEGSATANRSLKWEGSLSMGDSADYITIDVPIRDIAVGDTTSLYTGGTRAEFTAATNDTILDVDKLYGNSNNDLTTLSINLDGHQLTYIKDIYLYKEAEWRIENIKDYRDEYMQIAAVRVRGDRTSRRRAYG